MTVHADRPRSSVAGIGRQAPWPFTRAFLREYARNRVNLLLLVLVPTVFVVVVASSMADAAKLVWGVGGVKVETATAGWAAGFLAGIAMYFQVATTRDVDRRLVIAGLAPMKLALSRLLSGFLLAVGASVAALLALALRVGMDHPARVVAGTLMFAVVYVAIGSLAGAVFANPVNGTVFVRNPVQWLLFLLVPLIFVLAADAVTPDEPITLAVREGG